MAFRISKAASGTKPGAVKYPNGDELNFVYRPQAYTPDHEDAVAAARDEMRAGPTLKAMLLPLLVSWDVVDEAPDVDADGTVKLAPDGSQLMVQTPVPLTEDGLGRVPISVLNDVLKAITDDMSPDPTKSSSSEGSLS